MMEITAEIRALIDKAAAGMELAGDEYIDPADGLIHCKKCGGQRQTVVPCFGKPGYFMPRCICQCQREAEEQRKAAVLNRLTGMFSEDRADFIASFDEYDLLIIDDLGVERSTVCDGADVFVIDGGP